MEYKSGTTETPTYRTPANNAEKISADLFVELLRKVKEEGLSNEAIGRFVRTNLSLVR